MNPTDLITFVATELAKRADPDKAGPMATYMKTDMPFYGVQKPGRVPIERAFKRQFVPNSHQDWEVGIRGLWSQPHREEKYLAIGYARSFPTYLTPEALPLFEHLIRNGAWWDLVDDLVTSCTGEIWRNHRPETGPVMDRWIQDDCLWIRRAAIIGQIKHKDQTDTERLARYCTNNLSDKRFFVRKAIGWALRSYSYTNPSWVQRYVDEHGEQMSGLSRREALKQIQRLSEES